MNIRDYLTCSLVFALLVFSSSTKLFAEADLKANLRQLTNSFKVAISETYQEMNDIVASKDMTKDEKIQKLHEFLEKEAYWPAVLYRIAQVDKLVAQNIALNLFLSKTTSQEHRLQLGRLLLQTYKAPGFMREYAHFLIDAVLNDGEKEFCRKRERKLSAVGEYVFIASGFEGYSSDAFEKIKDKRVIPILIKCLNAPDNIYGKQQGCVIMGKVGEPTGRNVQRQQIPIALAKLGAVESIDALKKILMTHHDYWLRYNSAYALANLMDRKDSRTVEVSLKKTKGCQRFLFPFGTGLIKKGDDDGIKYMAFKYSTYFKSDSLLSVLYMVEERFRVLKGFKSKKMENFYKQVLEYKPLYSILIFDDKSVKPEDFGYLDEKSKQLEKTTNAGEVLSQYKGRIIAIYKDIIDGIRANRLETLSPVISKIGKQTRNTEIKKISEEYINEIGR